MKSQTINALESNEIISAVSLENNRDNLANHHHQFDIDGTPLISSKEITLVKSKSITLSFSGRVINQFPSHSLVFRFKDKGGYCRFDIVFFKDFPPYVRYLATLLIIMAMVLLIVFGWLLLSREKENKDKKELNEIMTKIDTLLGYFPKKKKESQEDTTPKEEINEEKSDDQQKID
jgi:hypothetical protein